MFGCHIVCLGCGFSYGLGAKRCGWFCPWDWKLLSSMTLINGKLTDEERAQCYMG